MRSNTKSAIKIIAVVGPTSSGKSHFAVKLAKKIGGEIISADSRQIYKGMDIGTGKITKQEMRGVPHYLLSIADPKRKIWNVSKFKKLADQKIADISSRGKTPILVGGTGFWIDAVAFNKEFPDVPANTKLRKSLAKKKAPQLFAMLQKLNPVRAKIIDRHNSIRLIRAIEIAKYNRADKLKFINNKKTASADTAPQPAQYEIKFIGLDLPTEKLYAKIEKRLDQRLKHGLLNEILRLHKKGVSWKKLQDFGLEYRFGAQFLQGKILNAKGKPDKNKMRELLLYAIKHYAKRQRTWFKRNKEINWFRPTKI